MSTTTESSKTATDTSSMTIRVYNTLSKTKEPLETVEPGKVGIYLCGPTVYKPSHIGHMVGPVIFDTVKRYLTYNGFQVTWVVNITDVDDKLIAEASRQGISMADVAQAMIVDYLDNLSALGVDQIDKMPKATEHMDGIIDFVKGLIEKDFAYAVDGDVFFDVAKDDQYGKLSNRTAESQQGEGGEAAGKKRSPSDFALWKSAKPDEPSWESPWGRGRPGWHIECSAMSHALLGETFDIHGGGLDLVFPHHENELAQSECCHGKPMVRYWMHNGLLRAGESGKVGGRAEREQQPDKTAAATTVVHDDAEESHEQAVGKKMGRSTGGGGLAELIARQGGDRIRFFLLRTHYRSTIVFNEAGIEEAGAGLDSFHRFFDRFERLCGESFYRLPAPNRRDGQRPSGQHPLDKSSEKSRQQFLSKMDDDFNTGGAVSELFDMVRSLNKFADQKQLDDAAARAGDDMDAFRRSVVILRELSQLLGLFLSPPASAGGGDDQLVGGLMALLIQLRANARVKKDFESADLIRNSLTEMGITLEDRKDGTEWRKS